MVNRILIEMNFPDILSGAQAQTQTGNEILNKYKAYIMEHEASCTLINNFIKEASQHSYDSGIYECLVQISKHINLNKISWALASACELLKEDRSSYKYLEKNYAVGQVEKILEMSENDIIKHIKAGALKNVMFCDSFKNIIKQVYRDTPLIESTVEYVKKTPVSVIENVGDGVCFQVEGTLYKIDENNDIMEEGWNAVSNNFKIISRLLESNMTSVDEHRVVIDFKNATYIVNNTGYITKRKEDQEKTMTVEEFREHNKLLLMTCNPNIKTQTAEVLESIAILAENYGALVNMDNVAIYSTKNDRFLVIEAGTNIYATLLMSNKNPKWTINENVVKAISFIKKKTNTSLNEVYSKAIEEYMDTIEEENKIEFQEQLKESEQQTYRERIENLTQKFRNDPIKLAVLSKIAKNLSEI